MSLSSWRAWIEINLLRENCRLTSRSPHGERGLKWVIHLGQWHAHGSLSSWRAWIEISCWTLRFPKNVVALLMESVD